MNDSFLIFLKQTSLFSGLEETEIKELLTWFEAFKKSYRKAEVVYGMGEQIETMGLILRGSVNIVVNYYWGGSNIFSHISAGQIFAETYAIIPSCELMVEVVAAEDTEILFLNVNRFLQKGVENNPTYTHMIQKMLQLSAQKNLKLSTRMLHIASKSIRERILSYLSQQALEQGHMPVTIPFSRQQLADYLGVDRSALSNELSKMQKDRILRVDRNTFWLLKEAGMIEK